ncbi:uncharacterized protein LOC135118000 [Helicoverpa armigera]|uniref:uncharacterized protein LOC135118000 n=1 Tax=Helicoverpa armigera TaxID=29058 RepID=UPI0030831D47
MMKILMTPYIILIASYFVGVGSSRAPTHLLVTRVGPCYDPQEIIVKVSELSVTTESYDSKLSGVINITEDIGNGWKIKATMQKCVDIRNIDTCDFFKSFFVVNNGCSADEVHQNLYNVLFNYTRPKIQCPIRAGNYNLLNYPFYSDDNYISVLESKISTSVFGYTISLEGYAANKKKVKKCFDNNNCYFQ